MAATADLTRSHLKNAREMLEMARRGLANATSDDPTERRPGIMNLATFGRSVTFVLQRLRTTDPDFDEWYAPRIAVLGADPVFVYFNDLRNAILKEGELSVSASMHVENFHSGDIAHITDNPPPGAKSFFMGDPLGGHGWEVEMPDGTIERFYVTLPSEIAVRTWLTLPNAPTEHLGSPIRDSSVSTLGGLYVGALSQLLDDATERFGS